MKSTIPLKKVNRLTMRIKFKLPVVAAMLIALSSCGNTENNKLIIGNWQATEWLVNGQPSNLKVETTSFRFNDKSEYTFEYAGTKETGSYKVENDMLFTTPKGQQEMMVRISKVTTDSLVFDMNRSGQPEILTLVKK